MRSCALGALVVVAAVMFATNGYSHHAQYYVLDGFGGVHAGGGAAAPPAGIPYFGFDIAKDIEFVPGFVSTDDGLLVLDGYGGVHTVGLGGVSPASTYFGFDIARGITYRNIPPRIAGSSSSATTVLGTVSATFTVLESVSITAPDDGFLLVIGSSLVGCDTGTAAEAMHARITINVDATTEPAAISNLGLASFSTCASAGGTILTNNQTVTHVFPVSAGAHTVNLLGRLSGQTGTTGARILGRNISTVFIDHGSTGTSDLQAPSPDAARAISQ